jgi:hypothetical protein
MNTSGNSSPNSAAIPLPATFCGHNIPLPTAAQNRVKPLTLLGLCRNERFFWMLQTKFSLLSGKAIRGEHHPRA